MWDQYQASLAYGLLARSISRTASSFMDARCFSTSRSMSFDISMPRFMVFSLVPSLPPGRTGGLSVLGTQEAADGGGEVKRDDPELTHLVQHGGNARQHPDIHVLLLVGEDVDGLD